MERKEEETTTYADCRREQHPAHPDARPAKALKSVTAHATWRNQTKESKLSPVQAEGKK